MQPAACLRIRLPRRYPLDEDAATAAGATLRNTRAWRAQIREALRSEGTSAVADNEESLVAAAIESQMPSGQAGETAGSAADPSAGASGAGDSPSEVPSLDAAQQTQSGHATATEMAAALALADMLGGQLQGAGAPGGQQAPRALPPPPPPPSPPSQVAHPNDVRSGRESVEVGALLPGSEAQRHSGTGIRWTVPSSHLSRKRRSAVRSVLRDAGLHPCIPASQTANLECNLIGNALGLGVAILPNNVLVSAVQLHGDLAAVAVAFQHGTRRAAHAYDHPAHGIAARRTARGSTNSAQGMLVIVDVAVAEQYRRLGLATMLYRMALRTAALANVAAIVVLSTADAVWGRSAFGLSRGLPPAWTMGIEQGVPSPVAGITSVWHRVVTTSQSPPCDQSQAGSSTSGDNGQQAHSSRAGAQAHPPNAQRPPPSPVGSAAWQRDLTSEGIEPNPGMTSKRGGAEGASRQTRNYGDSPTMLGGDHLQAAAAASGAWRACAGTSETPHVTLGGATSHAGAPPAAAVAQYSGASPPFTLGAVTRSHGTPGGAVAAQLQASPPAVLGGIAAASGHPGQRASPRLVKADSEAIDVGDGAPVLVLGAPRARATSPQPQTARDARRAAARQVAVSLQEDESQYALCADRPELLHGLVIDAATARDAGIPHGTASADEWGFAWVKRFCAATGNFVMRPRAVESTLESMREAYFAMLALLWIARMMPPSSRRKAQGYGQGKTTSALLAMYAYRRVMRDCGRYLPDMSEARGVFKGLCMQYKARWGDDAFVPERKQPFSTAQLLSIVALLAAGAVTGWSQTLCSAVLTAFCYAISTGVRRDEWTLSFEGDTYVKRCNFAWVGDDGLDLPQTREVIASRRNGHLLRGRSAASKCDRLNTEWGARDMYFRLNSANPLNFAWRWQQWELAHPCPPTERANWPAFSPSGDALPFTGSKADSCLKTVLLSVMSAAEAARHSWHACRVTIATRLFARRNDGIERDEVEGVIQALVRWKTVEAMRLYARMQPRHYADYVDMATTPDGSEEVSVCAPHDLPECDPSGVERELAQAMGALEIDARAAARAVRDARGVDATKATAGGAARKRKPNPSTGEALTADAATRPSFSIGGDAAVTDVGDESWGVVGQQLRVHNSFWGMEHCATLSCTCCVSAATVVGYIGRHAFPSGHVSRHTFVIESEGFNYPATHTTVANTLVDPAFKRRCKGKTPALVAGNGRSHGS